MYTNFIPKSSDYTGMSNVEVIAYRASSVHTEQGHRRVTIDFKFKFDVPVPIQDLKVKLPDGFEQVEGFASNPFVYNENGQGHGEVYVLEGWDYMVLRKGPSNFWGAVPAAPGLTFAVGQLTYNIQ